MKEQIEAKIKEWQHELNELNARRSGLAAAISDVDVSIQRHLGAITGAQQLLTLIPPEAEQPDAPAEPAEQPQGEDS